MLEIEQQHPRLMGAAKHAAYSSYFGQWAAFSLEHPQRRLWGSFVGAELRAYVGALLWESAPYYTVVGMKTRPGTHNMFSPNQPLASAFRLMLQEMEALGRYKFYFVRATEHWGRRAAKTFYASVPEYERYSRVIELELPKGVQPKWPLARNILNGNVLAVDSVLECATLRQEYRPTVALLRGVGT